MTVSTLTVFYSNQKLAWNIFISRGEMTSSGANHGFQGQPFGFTEKSSFLGESLGWEDPKGSGLKPG